jgi:hypothetical protein
MVNIPQSTNYIIALIIALVMFLTGYQTLELTRYIIIAGFPVFPDMKIHFILELTVIWGLYLSIPFVMNILIRELIRQAKKEVKT